MRRGCVLALAVLSGLAQFLTWALVGLVLTLPL